MRVDGSGVGSIRMERVPFRFRGSNRRALADDLSFRNQDAGPLGRCVGWVFMTTSA